MTDIDMLDLLVRTIDILKRGKKKSTGREPAGERVRKPTGTIGRLRQPWYLLW